MKETKIAETAIVRDCKIGEGTNIWNYANVYECEVGENCTVGSYTEIQNDVKVGNNVIICTHSFLCTLVTVEDNVFIGHGVMTINDVNPPSRKRTGTTAAWKPTLIKKGAVIGSNVTLFPVTIGKYAKIGAGAVVIKDVPDYAIVVGNPGKVIRIEKPE